MSSFFSRWGARAAAITAAFLVLVGAQSALAALATPTTYSVTRHRVSVTANHEIRMTTPTGVDAPTDTIVLSNYGAFDISAITIGDVDLFHGPVTGVEVVDTIAAAPGIGTWGVVIGATSITFTAPSDAAPGTVSPGDIITIRIGTNAVGGVDQIVNPSSPVEAQILINGTFGDVITVGVPIMSNDTVTVSATVEASSTPPVPPAPNNPPPTPTPPVLSNIQVINITSSTVRIIWDTDVPSNSGVNYGPTTLYENGTVSDAALVTSHSIDLIGLASNTPYHFQVSSRNSGGVLAVSSDGTFTTLGGVTPPVISNVHVIDITDVSARVVWDTNVLATSRVDYGTSTGYGIATFDPGYVSQHSMLLTGLVPSTVYHFFVTSGDQSANIATSPDGTFTTASDQTSPANVSGFTATPGDSVVHLSWTAPPDLDYAGVRIVRRTDTFPSGPQDGTLVYQGTGLTTDDAQVVNGTTYFYGAYAFDGNTNYSSGALAQATPVAPPLPPVQENTTALCSDGIDNDTNGLIDCADPGCVSLPICLIPPVVPPVIPPPVTPPIIPPVTPPSEPAVTPPSAPSSAITPSEPVPTPSGLQIAITPHYFGANGTIELAIDSTNQFGALMESTVLIRIPVIALGATPDKAYINVGGSAYSLTLNADGTAFVGAFVVPSVTVGVPITASVTFVGGGAAISDVVLLPIPGGQVVEQGLFGKTTTAISDATVTLYTDQGGAWVLWSGAQYGQSNPISTNANGSFAFTVPNGSYYVTIQKDQYTTVSSPPTFVTHNVYGASVGLVKIPILLPATATSTFIETTGLIVTNVVNQVGFAAKVAQAFIQEPAVQAVATNYVVPAAVGATVISVAGAVPLFNFLAYLQFFFTQPFLLLARRRRKKWGTVFNSLTKQPVDLAIVRLLDGQTRTIRQTHVTDKSGRYSFVVPKGRYILEVVKPGFVFPSFYLKDADTDAAYVDVYHGMAFDATEKDPIGVNIPVDPVTKTETPRQVLIKKFLRRLQRDVSFTSVLVSLLALILYPGVTSGMFAAAQVGLYLLFTRLAKPAHAKEWGIVYEGPTRKPLARAIVRIFDEKFNKLLETQITDDNGKYGFFVRRSIYYITVEREGYEKYRSASIDLTAKDEGFVDQNIELNKEKR